MVKIRSWINRAKYPNKIKRAVLSELNAKELKKLNAMFRSTPMTREQKQFLEQLRKAVKTGKLTRQEASKIWDKKYKIKR